MCKIEICFQLSFCENETEIEYFCKAVIEEFLCLLVIYLPSGSRRSLTKTLINEQ